MLREHRLFFREYLRHFHDTGAIAPSSRWLGRALARYVGTESKPCRVLEVGPGTGAVTRQIVRRLNEHDRLDLVELNEKFAGLLSRRFRERTMLRGSGRAARVINCPVEQLGSDVRYDIVVSGLPLNNFSVANVERISRNLFGSDRSGRHAVVLRICGSAAGQGTCERRAERRRLRGVGGALAEAIGRAEFHRECIWPNLPPAWVHHLRPGPAADERALP